MRKLAHVLRFHAIREIGPQKSFTAEGWRVECLYLLQLWDGQAPLAGEVAGGRMGLERLNEWLAPFPGSKELDPLTALARGLNAALRLPPGQAFSRDALEEAFKTESKCTGSSGGGVDEAKLSALVAAKGKTLADLESARAPPFARATAVPSLCPHRPIPAQSSSACSPTSVSRS